MAHATSDRKFILALIPTPSTKKRDEFINLLTRVAEDARENEPGTLKYAVFLDRNAAKETDIWIIEEYTNQAAYNQHMDLPVIGDMTKWLSENPASAAPNVRLLKYPSDSFQFSGPGASVQKDPWVVVAELDYYPGGVGASLSHWQAVVDEGRTRETGTLVYGILKDENHVEKLLTFEAYESEAYLKDVHLKSKAIEDGIKSTKHLWSGSERTFLQFKAGYLYK